MGEWGGVGVGVWRCGGCGVWGVCGDDMGSVWGVSLILDRACLYSGGNTLPPACAFLGQRGQPIRWDR